jgi:hypothetical protein
VNGEEIVLADDPAKFAEAVAELLADPGAVASSETPRGIGRSAATALPSIAAPCGRRWTLVTR